VLSIDGSQGEGGGQVLRTALALSLVTLTPIRIVHIRARRAKPGLRRQHLAAVRAAALVGRARVTGDIIGSRELTFEPTRVEPGTYAIDVGTAGSALLVAQTVLSALARSNGPSRLHIEGGTHNPLAPTFEFFALGYLPALARMGPRIEATLLRPGFVPRGRGIVELSISPAQLRPIKLLERGAITHRRALATVAGLPHTIAERERHVLERLLGWPRECFSIEELDATRGPGNVVTIEVDCEQVTEVFTGIGKRGVRAETVAERAAAEAIAWIEAGVPVGSYLADQLLLPMALAGRGVFRASEVTLHARTQIDVLHAFLDVPITIEREAERAFVFRLGL
jgi:RNA 3'-terminal phosphate cyclase (ATP)